MATNAGQFLRLKKLTGKEIVQVAMKHNLRELQKELGAGSHIDASRTKLNQIIAGPDTAEKVKQLADRLMLEAEVPNLRNDAVRAIEIIFSLPPVSSINHGQFFDDALAWSIEYFKVPILSAVMAWDSDRGEFISKTDPSKPSVRDGAKREVDRLPIANDLLAQKIGLLSAISFSTYFATIANNHKGRPVTWMSKFAIGAAD